MTEITPEEDVHKFEVTVSTVPAPPVPAFEDLGSLPASYGTNSLYLVARDPHWLFSYWDVNWADYPASLMLGGQNRIYLKLHEPNLRDVLTIEVKSDSRNWYIQAPAPSTRYYAELGYFDHDGKWAVIAKSETTATPSDRISNEEAAVFATLPMHLTFQHIMDLVRSSRRENESLVGTLSRLQNEAREKVFAHQKRNWSEEERFLIGSILGDAVSSGGLSSAELVERLREYLEERLSSASASELIQKLLKEAASSEIASSMFAQTLSERLSSEVSSELFALLLRERLSSETASEIFAKFLNERLSSEVSSEIFAKLSKERLSSETSSEIFAKLVQETLSSALSSEVWSRALTETLSSETSSAIFARVLSETLSSSLSSEIWSRLFRETLSSETSSALFTQLFAERLSSETASEIFAKFLSERLSSQSASEMLSKGLFWSVETTSLFSAFGPLGAFGSWGAFGSETFALLKAAETFSSWGGLSSETTSWSSALGSSWSAQPFSEQPQREFFMHVNAEVIFYGGTHPDAKVTIDGKPIQLNADGSFRYHFRFPDGSYEVPIVATSPDGVEQRKATLRFDRETQRVGVVGETGQPADLTLPIGKKA